MDRMDLSLDEIISEKKGSEAGRGRKRGGATRGGGAGGRGAFNGKRKHQSGPYSVGTSIPFAWATFAFDGNLQSLPRRNTDEPWRHDMYEGADLRERLSSRVSSVRGNSVRTTAPGGGVGISRVATAALRAAVGGAAGTFRSESVSIVGSAGGPSKITVANLHPDASADDVKAVFAEFGPIQSCVLSIDAGGNGNATIVYESRKSSLAAIEKYHNKVADGKTLKVVEVVMGLSIAGAAKSAVPDAARAAGPFGGGGMYSDRMQATLAFGASTTSNRPVSERLGRRPDNAGGSGGPTFQITI
ncbi:hypothetical protein HDU97_000565 [Phlyctochytrium planicorne]|nr:hypothetical protein HDU97_000565 [Phlyctochytrium planicorne]